MLHLPNDQKPTEAFEGALVQYLASGRTNLRFVYFPSHANFGVAQLERTVDLRDITVRGQLSLSGLHFKGDLLISGTVDPIVLSQSTVDGKLDIRVLNTTTLEAPGTKLRQGFILEVGQISTVNLRRAELAGSTIFRGRFQGRVFFDDASVDGTLDLCECIFEQQPNFPRTLFSANTKLLLLGVESRTILNLQEIHYPI